MDYNTTRNKLKMPEYGRHIQKMVEMLTQMTEEQEKEKYIESIIKTIEILNPEVKDEKDYQKKIREHLYIMSDFKLDIKHKDGSEISKEKIISKPARIQYPNRKIKHKHYGNSIQEVLKYAEQMEDGEQKDTLIALTANHMKKTSIIWSNKNNVTDQEVFRDLENISDKKVKVTQNIKLSSKDKFPIGNFSKKQKRKKNKKK